MRRKEGKETENKGLNYEGKGEKRREKGGTLS